MTDSVHSKPIRATDESAKLLIQELLSSTKINLSDIDSYYHIDGTYLFIEFIKCSNLKSFNCLKYDDIQDVTISINPLVQFVRQARGILYLTIYNDNKDTFILISTKLTNDNRLMIETVLHMSNKEYSEWFKDINKRAIGL